MHKVYFRFYEELNDFLHDKKRKVRFVHYFTDRASVKDMIESLGVPHTEVDLILVNGNPVDFNYKVNYDDEISVYPVFESFDVSEVQHLRNKPLREPKFIADVHLGKLAKYLRMLGIDTFYKNTCTEDELINISLTERRTILTQNRNLLKRNIITHGYWVRGRKLKDQIEEIFNRFQLDREINEFSRCIICNDALIDVNKADVLPQLPEMVKNNFDLFKKCPACQRIYWKGSHYLNMKETTKFIGKRDENGSLSEK